jgi:hypothetical protein
LPVAGISRRLPKHDAPTSHPPAGPGRTAGCDPGRSYDTAPLFTLRRRTVRDRISDAWRRCREHNRVLRNVTSRIQSEGFTRQGYKSVNINHKVVSVRLCAVYLTSFIPSKFTLSSFKRRAPIDCGQARARVGLRRRRSVSLLPGQATLHRLQPGPGERATCPTGKVPRKRTLTTRPFPGEIPENKTGNRRSEIIPSASRQLGAESFAREPAPIQALF